MTYVTTATEHGDRKRRERSKVWQQFEAHCESCDWTAGERRPMESDAWSDLVGHLRVAHNGSVRMVRVKRTTIDELLEEGDQ